MDTNNLKNLIFVDCEATGKCPSMGKLKLGHPGFDACAFDVPSETARYVFDGGHGGR